jgi:hypothetical protein
MTQTRAPAPGKGFGLAWLASDFAFALHFLDQARHDFIGYYNATVLSLYGHYSRFPRMDTSPGSWLSFIIAILVLFAMLTPFAFKNARWMQILAATVAAVQFLEGSGVIVATLRGGTVPSVHFDGVAPGFYTAPLLLLASAYLLCSLIKQVI